MIQIYNKQRQEIFIPISNFTERVEIYDLHIFNSVYSTEIGVTDSMKYASHYNFMINFKNIPDGEYKYELLAGNKIVSKGLISIGLKQNTYHTYEPKSI